MKQKTAMTDLLEAIEYFKEVVNKQGEPYFNMVKAVAENLKATTEREQIEEAAVTVAQKAGNIVIENMKEPRFENDFNFDAAKAAKECREFADNYYQQKYGDENPNNS